MHWKNQPRWRRPDEVTEPGDYVLTRTDDDELRGTIHLDEELRCWDNDVKHVSPEPVSTWDEECRFFGPIPKREE